jgi:peptidoglycan/LPS O-acetylase OafA/YrhL
VLLGVLVATIVTPFPAQPLLFAVLFPLLITSTVSNPTSLTGRALELRAACWLGRLSYSLYIWHVLFLQSPPSQYDDSLSPLRRFPVNVAAILACATASYCLVERPMIRLGRRLSQRGADSKRDSPVAGDESRSERVATR